MRFDAGLLLTGQRFPRHRYEVRSTPAQGRADYHWHSLAVELGGRIVPEQWQATTIVMPWRQVIRASGMKQIFEKRKLRFECRVERVCRLSFSVRRRAFSFSRAS